LVSWNGELGFNLMTLFFGAFDQFWMGYFL
jgi:hypothetical protein